jgi:hypothetical protein
MTRLYALYLFILVVGNCLLASHSIAQRALPVVVNAQAQQLLKSQAIDLFKAEPLDFKVALLNNWPIQQRLQDGREIQLVGIQNGQPIFYVSHSSLSAQTIGTTNAWAGGSLGLTLAGSGYVIGLWDLGPINVDHTEIVGRSVQRDGGGACNLHATQVASILGAGGVNPLSRGMANQATVHAYDATNDLSEMSNAAADQLLVSTHTYGPVAGWSQLEGGRFRWNGDVSISPTEDYTFGFYDSRHQNLDQLLVNASFYLPVASVGNDRNENGPSAGQSHEFFDVSTQSFVTSSAVRNPDGNYDCISGLAIAKNVLSVGAVQGSATGFTTPENVRMTDFSAWGPTDDGRIKPDVVAAGVGILAAGCERNDQYAALTGTSAAAPAVAGSALLLQEHYSNRNSGNVMRASSLKGLIIHTADDAGPAGPDYSYGWGQMNTTKAIGAINNNNTTTHIIEQVLANRGSLNLSLEPIGTEPVRVTICWTDPAGTPAAIALDPTRTMLVNDLDARLTQGANIFSPYVLNPAAPFGLASTGDNARDNVEQILIASPRTGNMNLVISHKGNLVGGTQIVSIIISGARRNQATTCARPESLRVPVASISNTSAVINWNPVPNISTYLLQWKPASTTSYFEEAVQVNSFTLTGLTAGTEYDVRIRANCSGVESDFSQEVRFRVGGVIETCTTPTNVNIPPATLSDRTAIVNWATIPAAVTYRVEWRVVGNPTTTTDIATSNTITLRNLTAGAVHEVRVQSLCPNGAISAFSNFVRFTTRPPLVNCTAPVGLAVPPAGVLSDRLSIVWSPITDAQSYTVNFRPVGTSLFSTRVVNGNISTFMIQGLAANTEYEISVQASCNGVNSPESQRIIARTATEDGRCALPTNFRVQDGSLTSSTVTLLWTGNPQAIAYQVEYRPSGTTSFTLAPNAFSGTMQLTGLNPNTRYEARVKSFCGATESNFTSNIAFITTNPSLTCAAPANTSVSTALITTTSAVVNWAPVSGAVNGYVVESRPVGAQNFSVVPVARNQTSLTLNNLTPGTEYEFRVQSVCDGLSSVFTPLVSFRTGAVENCLAPINITLTDRSQTIATLSWNEAAFVTSGYQVSYRAVGAGTFIALPINSRNSQQITNLTLNTTYEARVQSLCAAGISAPSNLFTFTTLGEIAPPPCATPTGLAVPTITTQSAEVVWNASSDVFQYIVDYRIANTSTFNTISVSPPATRTSLPSLLNGAQYEVRVSALCVNQARSLASPSVFFTTSSTPPIDCQAPLDFKTVFIGVNEAQFGWERAMNASSYNFDYRRINDESWTSINQITVNGIAISTFEPRTTYQARVRTICSNNASSATSPVIQFTTGSSDLCLPPVDLQVNFIQSNRASVSWRAEGNATGYRFEYRPRGVNFFQGLDVFTIGTTLSGLTPNTTYEIRVRSNCAQSQQSSFSAIKTFTTTNISSCAIPTGVNIVNIGTTSGQIIWQPVATAQNYTVRYGLLGSSQLTTLTTANTSLQLSNLQNGVTYQVSIQANCANGDNSPFSEWAQFGTSIPPACVAPTNLTAVSVSENTATFEWNAVSNVISYTVEYRQTNDANWTNFSFPGRTLQLGGLRTGRDYQIRVSSLCANNVQSNFSPVLEFRTGRPISACLSPNRPSVTSLSSTAAQVSWNSVASAESYSVFFRPAGNADFQVQRVLNTSTSFNNLTPGISYEVKVQTNCANANSPESEVVRFTTSNECRVPGNVAVRNIGTDAATIVWSVVTSANSYGVEYRQIGANDWLFRSVNNNSFNFSNLLPGTTYEVQVNTLCTTGESSDFSALIQFTTESPCPSTRDLIINNIGITSANLAWSVVPGAIGYNILYRNANSSNWLSVRTTQPTISIIDLQPSTTYQARIQTQCFGGLLANFSTVITFTTAGTCVVPGNVNVSGITPTQAEASWSPIPGAIGYEVDIRPTNASNFQTLISSTNSLTLRDLMPRQNYEVRVRSRCGNGLVSAPSNSINFATAMMVCSPPAGVQFSNIGQTSVSFNWNTVANVQSYVVAYRPASSSTWTELTTSANSLSVGGLTRATTYQVRVLSVCLNSTRSDWSVETTLLTAGDPVGLACPAPTGLRAENVLSDQATIAWVAVTAALRYEVSFNLLGDSRVTTRSAFGNTIALSELLPNRTYEVQVKTTCTNNRESVVSEGIRFTTSSQIVPGSCPAPMNVRLVRVSAASASIQWDRVNGASRYVVNLRPANNSTAPIEFNFAGTNMVLGGLTPSTAYILRIRSACNDGTISTTAVEFNFQTTPGAGSETGNDRISVTEGVEEIQSELSLYPNPNNGQFSVSGFNQNNQFGFVSYAIYDVMGRKMVDGSTRVDVGNNQMQVDASGLPSGIYILTLPFNGKQASIRFHVFE